MLGINLGIPLTGFPQKMAGAHSLIPAAISKKCGRDSFCPRGVNGNGPLFLAAREIKSL